MWQHALFEREWGGGAEPGGRAAIHTMVDSVACMVARMRGGCQMRWPMHTSIPAKLAYMP